MRQRGAGVRAITADFGFSFALPLAPTIAHSIAQLDPPAEPPAKRCRTNGPVSPKRCGDEVPERTEKRASRPAEAAEQPDPGRTTVKDRNQPAPTIHGDVITTAIEAISTEQAPKATKKAPRARRKLCLDDIVEELEAQQNNEEVRTGGLEDTFIFGFTPKKQKVKAYTEEIAIADEPKQKKKAAAPRVKKATKAREQLEDKLDPDQDAEPAKKSKRPERKAKTTRGKAVAGKHTATITTEVDASKSRIDNSADHGLDDSNGFFSAAEVLPEDTVETEPKPIKTKPAPKRALKRSVHEVVTAAENMDAATPEKPAKRPRRQAAISAIEKVAMGYEDELIPVDKLRRAPDAESQPRKSRKADADGASTNALLSPPLTTQSNSTTKDTHDCGRNEPPSSPPLVVKRGRKPGVATAKGRACKSDGHLEVVEALPVRHVPPTSGDNRALDDEPRLSPKLPAKRGRKPGVKVTKGRTCAADERQEVTQPQPAEHLSPTKEDNHALDDERPLSPKLPAKRGRKPGSTNKRVVAATNQEESIVVPTITKSASNHLSPAKENDCVPEEELTLAPKLPAKRGRKPDSKNRKLVAATNHEESTVESAVTESASNHLSSAKESNYTPDDEPAIAPKLPAKRGRKPGVKNRKVTTNQVEPPTEPIVTESAPMEKTSIATRSEQTIDTGSEPQTSKTSRDGRAGATERLRDSSENARSTEPSQEASEHSDPLAKQPSRESSWKTIEEQPKKQRRALADFDGNIARKSLTVEGKKVVSCAIDSASVPRMQQSKTRKTVKESAVRSDTRVDTFRAGKLQLLPQLESSLNEGPRHETTTTSKRRRVNPAEEDVDWLFEKPESRHPKPATIRHPATKARREAADQNAQDMDVDDLLVTVDGFADGGLLTGRRGRVVAS
ncbi:hypothetical protein Q7P35_000602 [Cladosporium inversicolor]